VAEARPAVAVAVAAVVVVAVAAAVGTRETPCCDSPVNKQAAI
jgi:hypothetical protein